MINTYEEYKKAIDNTQYKDIVEFKNLNPKVYDCYQDRMKRENLKRLNPIKYAMEYGNPQDVFEKHAPIPTREAPIYTAPDTSKEDRLLRELEELRKM